MTTPFTRALALIASGYTRSAMERVYDRLMDDSRVGAELRGLSPAQKRVAEFALHASVAIADARISENTPVGILLKQVLMDAGPEIARRLFKEAGLDPDWADQIIEGEWTEVPARNNAGKRGDR